VSIQPTLDSPQTIETDNWQPIAPDSL
jgi:hypothetical protein